MGEYWLFHIFAIRQFYDIEAVEKQRLKKQKKCLNPGRRKNNICKGDFKFVLQTNTQGNIFQCFGKSL